MRAGGTGGYGGVAVAAELFWGVVLAAVMIAVLGGIWLVLSLRERRHRDPDDSSPT